MTVKDTFDLFCGDIDLHESLESENGSQIVPRHCLDLSLKNPSIFLPIAYPDEH